MRHGGRYGGGLSSTKGLSPNPNLKSTQPPSVAIVSKDYKNSYSNSSTISYNKKSDFISTSNSRNNLMDEAKLSIYSIDTSHHRSTANSNQNMNKNQEKCAIVPPPPPPQQQLKATSILNQPLPDIPKSAIKLPEQNKNNSQQPLCATNLNQYRSLQRPTKSMQQQQHNPNQNIPKSTKIVAPTPKILPPLLPPKNRHKDDSNRNRQSTHSTSTMPKNSNSNQTNFNNNKNSTHTTFGYERGQNMNNHQVNFQQTLEQLQHHSSKSLRSINDNNRSYSHSNSNKVNYQTLQHPSRSERAAERAAEKLERSERTEKPERYQASFNNSQHSQPQYHQKNYEKSSNMRRERRENGAGRGEADGGHHNNHQVSNKKDDPPIYYRSLQRGGTHANHDLYSVTEL